MIRGEHLTTLEMVTTTLDMLSVERPLLASGEVVVGIDEVGRGALAGPLTVGAVVLTCCDAPPDTLTDSKLLTAARREALVEPLERWAADGRSDRSVHRRSMRGDYVWRSRSRRLEPLKGSESGRRTH